MVRLLTVWEESARRDIRFIVFEVRFVFQRPFGLSVPQALAVRKLKMDLINRILVKPRKIEDKWNFKCRRQELIQQFVDEINIGRRSTRFPPIDAKRINSQYLWTMSTWELEVFFKDCSSSDNFGKKFFGSFKKTKPKSTKHQ